MKIMNKESNENVIMKIMKIIMNNNDNENNSNDNVQ
jgi:hypothetical protein